MIVDLAGHAPPNTYKVGGCLLTATGNDAAGWLVTDRNGRTEMGTTLSVAIDALLEARWRTTALRRIEAAAVALADACAKPWHAVEAACDDAAFAVADLGDPRVQRVVRRLRDVKGADTVRQVAVAGECRRVLELVRDEVAAIDAQHHCQSVAAAA